MPRAHGVASTSTAPSQLSTRLERRGAAGSPARCLREVDKVHRHGTEVTVMGPGPDDLEAMGGNLMEAGRRGRCSRRRCAPPRRPYPTPRR